MIIMEDNKHGGIGHVVHNTVIQVIGVGAFGWWHYHVPFSKGIIPRQHTTEVHALLPVLVGPGIRVLCRVCSLDSKVCTVAITSS